MSLGFALPYAAFAPGDRSGVWIAKVLTLCLPGALLLGLYIFIRGAQLNARNERLAGERQLNVRQQNITARQAFVTELQASYSFVLQTFNASEDSLLCMTADGALLRFLRIDADQGRVAQQADFTLPITRVVSVELIKNEQVYTQSATVTRKKGAIGRAVAGELLFGGVGAVVGAVSAGSTSTTLGAERRDYQSSELVFGLADLNRPVVRFIHNDHAEADRWLHRVRSAMAQAGLGAKGGSSPITSNSAG